MQILLVAFGTRGDVQPMLALAKRLLKAGHAVKLIAAENFADWVNSQGVDFIPSLNIEAVMQSQQGVAWVESNGNAFKELQIMRKLLIENGEQMVKPLLETAPWADLIISGFVSEPFCQSVAEKFTIKQINASLQPYRPTKNGAATLQPLVKGNSHLNYLMGLLAERFIWWVANETTNQTRALLGLKPHKTGTYLKASHQIPTLYAFSRYVVPPVPQDEQRIFTTGYWFLDEDESWTPPDELLHFLKQSTPPIYFGFGSMSSSDPDSIVRMIRQALERTQQRGIIVGGWGNLKLENKNDDPIYWLDKAPHSWLFPRMAAVVHHGRAGTTAAGLRAGKPTLIVPHMSDQPYWGRRVNELGAGPKPVPRHKLTVDSLSKGVTVLTKDEAVVKTAAALGEKIRQEDGLDKALEIIEKLGRA